MKGLAKNLKTLRELESLTQKDIAGKIGVSLGMVGSYEEGRNMPPLGVLLKYAEYFNISLDALVKGDVSKLKSLTDMIAVGNNRVLFPIILDEKERDIIEVVPVSAAAGYPKNYYNPDYVENDLLKMRFPFVKGKCRAFPIKGDSMPPLTEDCFVIAEFVESPYNIKDGEPYIVVTKDDLLFKRVYDKRKKLGHLELHSDNKKVETYSVDMKEVKELWKYRMVLNTSKRKPENTGLEDILIKLHDLQLEIEQLKK